MTNMSLTFEEQFIFFLVLAIIMAVISTAVCWLLLKEKRWKARIYAITALSLLSFTAFYFHDYHRLQLLMPVILLFAILWFPAAVILAGLVIAGESGSQPRPAGVFITSVLVYLIETYFDAYISQLLGLRMTNVLILIPGPALPYPWMQTPAIYLLLIQFCITFLLAGLIFWLGMKLNKKFSGNTEGDPAS